MARVWPGYGQGKLVTRPSVSLTSISFLAIKPKKSKVNSKIMCESFKLVSTSIYTYIYLLKRNLYFTLVFLGFVAPNIDGIYVCRGRVGFLPWADAWPHPGHEKKKGAK